MSHKFHGYAFIYGTAWKKERTTELVVQALRAGFRCFDTAAQPKHYREDLVAEGIRTVLLEEEGKENGLRREDLFARLVLFPFFLIYLSLLVVIRWNRSTYCIESN